MMYICIENKIKQRIVTSTSACRFRITEKYILLIEGPSGKIARYNIAKECIFFTSDDKTVINFIKKSLLIRKK